MEESVLPVVEKRRWYLLPSFNGRERRGQVSHYDIFETIKVGRHGVVSLCVVVDHYSKKRTPAYTLHTRIQFGMARTKALKAITQGFAKKRRKGTMCDTCKLTPKLIAELISEINAMTGKEKMIRSCTFLMPCLWQMSTRIGSIIRSQTTIWLQD